METFNWAGASARILKGEIAKAGLTLGELARRLERLDVPETEVTLKNKLYRGTFSMVFFVQCMQALGHAQVDLSAVLPDDLPKGRQLD